MSTDGRPTLASLPAITDALVRKAPDEGRAQRLRIITRHPDRYTDYGAPGWSIDVAWCTPRPGRARLPYSSDAILEDLRLNSTKATAYLIDILDVEGPTADDVGRWLIALDDVTSAVEVDLYILIDHDVHAPHDVSRWASIVPLLTLQENRSSSVESTAPEGVVHEATTQSSDRVDSDVHDGLRHLTTLPSGFSVDALRRRILQWRRMGFDVADLESALVHDGEERERMYRHVEQRIRWAVDLDRQLNVHAERLAATEVEHFRFRIRQLTGLEDIEAKLASHQA